MWNQVFTVAVSVVSAVVVAVITAHLNNRREAKSFARQTRAAHAQLVRSIYAEGLGFLYALHNDDDSSFQRAFDTWGKVKLVCSPEVNMAFKKAYEAGKMEPHERGAPSINPLIDVMKVHLTELEAKVF